PLARGPCPVSLPWLSLFLVVCAAGLVGSWRAMRFVVVVLPLVAMPGLARGWCCAARRRESAPALHHRVPVRNQLGVIDVVDRQMKRLSIARDDDLAGIDAPEDALEVAALAGRERERCGELDLGLAASEVREVLLGAQRPIDARRADLEVKRLRDRVLDVEHRRQLARQLLAI